MADPSGRVLDPPTVLLCAEGSGEPLVRLTRRRGLPFVALSAEVADPAVPPIVVDNRGGARLAAERLLALGHRRLAVLGIEFSPDGGLLTPEQERGGLYTGTRNRLLGYWDAAAAAGVDRERVPVFATRNDRATVEAGMAVPFDGPEPPTGLLAMSDNAALLATEWLAARGLRVPRDVPVVGFDGCRRPRKPAGP